MFAIIRDNTPVTERRKERATDRSSKGGAPGRGRAPGRPTTQPDPPVDRFPADLLTSERPSKRFSDCPVSWWLAHTRPRQEKAVAAELFALCVPFYVPLLCRKSLTRGRMRSANVPLFPSYVFVLGSDEDRIAALKTNRVVTMQKVPDGERFRQQLLPIAEAIAAGMPLVRESRLVPGERVRIKSGLLRDVEGVVLRRNGKTELLIAVDFLRQGAALEIEDCLLELV